MKIVGMALALGLLLAACGPSSGVVAPEEQAEDYKIVGYMMGRRSLDLRRIEDRKSVV